MPTSLLFYQYLNKYRTLTCCRGNSIALLFLLPFEVSLSLFSQRLTRQICIFLVLCDPFFFVSQTKQSRPVLPSCVWHNLGKSACSIMGRAGPGHSLHKRKIIYAAAVALWHQRHCQPPRHTSSKDVLGSKLRPYLRSSSISYSGQPVPEVVNGLPEAQPLAGGLTPKG